MAAQQLPQLTLDSATDVDAGVLPSPPPDVVAHSPRTPLTAAAKHLASDLVLQDMIGQVPHMDLMPPAPARTVESTFGRVVGDQDAAAAAEEEEEKAPRAVLPAVNARGTEHRAAAREGHGDLVAAAATVDDADSDDPDFSADDQDKDDGDQKDDDDKDDEEGEDDDEEEATADGSASEADPDATEDEDHEDDEEPAEEKTRAAAPPRVRKPKVTTRATHEKIMEVNGIRPGNWPGFKAGAVCVMELKGVTHSVVRVIDATACEHKRNSPQFKEGRVELSNFVHLRVPLSTALPPQPQTHLDQAPQYLTFFCEFSGKFSPIGPGPTAALLRQRWDRDQFSMPCRKVLFGDDMAPKSWDQACLRAAALCNRYGTAHSPILPECLFRATTVWNKLLLQAWVQHRGGAAASSSSTDAARQTALEQERMHAASIQGLDKAVRTQLLGAAPAKAKKRGSSSGSKAVGAIAKAVSFAGKATQAAKEQAAAGSNSPAAKKPKSASSSSSGAPLAVGPPSSVAPPAAKKPAHGLANGSKAKKSAPVLASQLFAAEPPAKKAKPTAPAPAAAAALEPEAPRGVAAVLDLLQQHSADSGEEEEKDAAGEVDEEEKALRLQLEALREKKKRAAEEAARKKKEAEQEAARKAAALEAARKAEEERKQQEAEAARKAAAEQERKQKQAAELERLKAQEAKEAERAEERKQQPPPLAHKRKPAEAALAVDGCECRCCTHHDSLLQLRLFAKALKVAWAVTPCSCKCCELAHKIDVPLLAFGQMMRANQVVPDELELLRNFESTLTERKRQPQA